MGKIVWPLNTTVFLGSYLVDGEPVYFEFKVHLGQLLYATRPTPCRGALDVSDWAVYPQAYSAKLYAWLVSKAKHYCFWQEDPPAAPAAVDKRLDADSKANLVLALRNVCSDNLELKGEIGQLKSRIQELENRQTSPYVPLYRS